jgi:hypothetical protein
MSDDVLKKYPVDQVAAWYQRLAEGWQQKTPELQPSLASVFFE